MKTRSKWRSILSSGVGMGIVLSSWWVLSLSMDPVRLPSPPVVFKAFLQSLFYYPKIGLLGGGTAGFGPHLLYTARSYFIATSIGIVSGVAVGVVMAWSKKILNFLEPPLELLRTTPSLVVLPFFLMWFGPEAVSQVALIIFYCFVMIVVNALNAIRDVDPVYPRFALVLGATRAQVFRTVILPAIIPELLGGIRVALAASWGFVVVAELMGSFYGVGKLFVLFMPYFHTTGIIVGIIWVLLFAIITDVTFMRATRPITRWMYEEI